MTDKGRRVLVVGAGGFVGRAVVRRLRDAGYAVRAAQRTAPEEPLDGVDYRIGDLMDAEYDRRLVEGVDILLYGAAFKKNVDVHTRLPFTSFIQNQAPLITFLECLAPGSVQRLVYLGSVYAEDPAADTQARIDGYATAKRAGELTVRGYAQEHGTPLSLIRAAPVYGPGNDTRPESANVIPSLLLKCHQAERRITVWGSGKRQVQFIYIDDLVENLAHIVQDQNPAAIYTLGNPEIVTIDDIATHAIAAHGKPLVIEHDTTKPDKPSTLYSFTNPVAPHTDLSSGIALTHAWMERHRRYV